MKLEKRAEKKIERGKIIVLSITFVLIISLLVIINNFYSTGKSVQQIQVVPLSAKEQQKVTSTILSSDFIKEIPEKYPVSIRFFSFENGQRIWHDSFLIGKDKLLTSGKPEIYLTLHSKYIPELNNNNLCEVIKKANQNRDLGFYSESNKASLLWKYKGMLKYRDCLGV